MGDNLVPNGLSRGFKIVYSKSRSSLRPLVSDLLCSGETARAVAINPARAAPLWASGVDRDSGASKGPAMPRMHES
ncbi:hypothetical protein ABIB90_008480, partial [Bradyrhizobium sp. JR4.1]|uniref:hypothetical protein n=1 Tax=Bradyrhizobium sp. JR4.1 TaxID=3156372 RepID=UPI0033953A01